MRAAVAGQIACMGDMQFEPFDRRAGRRGLRKTCPNGARELCMTPNNNTDDRARLLTPASGRIALPRRFDRSPRSLRADPHMPLAMGDDLSMFSKFWAERQDVGGAANPNASGTFYLCHGPHQNDPIYTENLTDFFRGQRHRRRDHRDLARRRPAIGAQRAACTTAPSASSASTRCSIIPGSAQKIFSTSRRAPMCR